VDFIDASPAERAQWVKDSGLEVGFDDVGIAGPGPYPEMAQFDDWLDRGYHGRMGYMEKNRARRSDPSLTVPDAKSVIVVALDYNTSHPLSTEVSPDPERGWISRYAWGDDYHDVIESMLRPWCERLATQAPSHTFRPYVDHGPVLEKVFARYAGLGWMGKHTNLIHPGRGSWFFLAVIITDLELAVDEPIPDHCGTCTACLDACPTQAFPQPYVLDARRCISYLTIELKDDVPDEFRSTLGQQVFGCDICQDVCPWNRKPEAPGRAEFEPREGAYRPNLKELETLDIDTFRERFRRSPVKRRGRERLQHTAAVVREGLSRE
jgi:epoxyqueuosine reductase